MKSQRGCFPHWAVRNTLKTQKKALLPHSESPLFFQRALWSCLDAFSFVPHRPMSHRLGAIATSKIGNATGLSFASRYAALQRVCLDSEKAWNLILDSQARMIFGWYLLYHHAPLSLVNPRFNDHLREWHYQRQTGTFFQIWQPPGLNKKWWLSEGAKWVKCSHLGNPIAARWQICCHLRKNGRKIYVGDN